MIVSVRLLDSLGDSVYFISIIASGSSGSNVYTNKMPHVLNSFSERLYWLWFLCFFICPFEQSISSANTGTAIIHAIVKQQGFSEVWVFSIFTTGYGSMRHMLLMTQTMGARILEATYFSL